MLDLALLGFYESIFKNYAVSFKVTFFDVIKIR